MAHLLYSKPIQWKRVLLTTLPDVADEEWYPTCVTVDAKVFMEQRPLTGVGAL